MTHGEMVQRRKAICRACPLNKKIVLDAVRVCSPIARYDADGRVLKGCGCILGLKVRIAGQFCPEAKWGPVVKGEELKVIDKHKVKES